MEDFLQEKKTMVEEPLLDNTHEKGGFRTLPFIIGIMALEQMSTFGVSPNMTLYMMNEYHMDMKTASNVWFMWSATTNSMLLFGALISDSFLGRFYTIGFGSIISLLGMILLWSTTVIPQAKPPPCDPSSDTCISPSVFQFVYLCSSLGLISIGAGAIRSSSLAFGADQLEEVGFHKRPLLKERYFSWYYAAYTLSILVALTCVVYIQDNLGWPVGFAVPTVLMVFGVCVFFLASPFYVKFKSETSLITGFVQVVIASFKNRQVELLNTTNYAYHCKTGSTLVVPSAKLRFLNKSCIVRDPKKDLTPEGRAKDPWTLCTVDQVEELKSLLRVVPIWLSGSIMAINISQSSFPLLQAVSMDKHITSNFEIPAASFSFFTVVAVILWVVLYDRVFLPVASRVMGRQVHIPTRRRMGIGIFFSFLAMLVSAIVEGVRRYYAIRVSVKISALWLVPQNCLSGMAEASNAIAQNEFYFLEFPRSMSSIASILLGIGMSVANLMASLIMNIVDGVSKIGGKESWISSDINKGNYDYYYFVLAGLSVANMVYFVVCSKGYGPSKEERKMEENEDEF
ncbi:hypothetical protein ACS0TY_022717 [Phlomoides rotata]